jgi:hypothetical protein
MIMVYVCNPMSKLEAMNSDVQEVFCRTESDDDLEYEVLRRHPSTDECPL